MDGGWWKSLPSVAKIVVAATWFVTAILLTVEVGGVELSDLLAAFGAVIIMAFAIIVMAAYFGDI